MWIPARFAQHQVNEQVARLNFGKVLVLDRLLVLCLNPLDFGFELLKLLCGVGKFLLRFIERAVFVGKALLQRLQLCGVTIEQCWISRLWNQRLVKLFQRNTCPAVRLSHPASNLVQAASDL